MGTELQGRLTGRERKESPSGLHVGVGSWAATHSLGRVEVFCLQPACSPQYLFTHGAVPSTTSILVSGMGSSLQMGCVGQLPAARSRGVSLPRRRLGAGGGGLAGLAIGLPCMGIGQRGGKGAVRHGQAWRERSSWQVTEAEANHYHRHAGLGWTPLDAPLRRMHGAIPPPLPSCH